MSQPITAWPVLERVVLGRLREAGAAGVAGGSLGPRLAAHPRLADVVGQLLDRRLLELAPVGQPGVMALRVTREGLAHLLGLEREHLARCVAASTLPEA
jgi:hypothetical protein